MPTLGECERDDCGVYSCDDSVREVVESALCLDDAGLAQCGLEELEAAEDALRYCARWQCRHHQDERTARDALVAAIHAEQARLEAVEDEQARDGDCCGGTCCGRCV